MTSRDFTVEVVIFNRGVVGLGSINDVFDVIVSGLELLQIEVYFGLGDRTR